MNFKQVIYKNMKDFEWKMLNFKYW